MNHDKQTGLSSFIRRFEELGVDDVALVGGKNASLGELCRDLGPTGIGLARGFALTADAYRYFLSASGLDTRLREMLAGLDTSDVGNLQKRGRRVRQAILAATMPREIERQVLIAYDELGAGEMLDVAVRSSATAEDLPDASFAGQQETYLNVQGHRLLLDTCRRCFASL